MNVTLINDGTNHRGDDVDPASSSTTSDNGPTNRLSDDLPMLVLALNNFLKDEARRNHALNERISLEVCEAMCVSLAGSKKPSTGLRSTATRTGFHEQLLLGHV